ncbi:MAG: hypothetical protein GY800_04135 [Planctomycetes bacterium]|nr:hypothetical protein [Planctomycetota bacterium]
MIWRADAVKAQEAVDDLVKIGMDQGEAIEQVRRAEVCNCRRPMRFDGGRWICECKRFAEAG